MKSIRDFPHKLSLGSFPNSSRDYNYSFNQNLKICIILKYNYNLDLVKNVNILVVLPDFGI